MQGNGVSNLWETMGQMVQNYQEKYFVAQKVSAKFLKKMTPVEVAALCHGYTGD